MIVQGIVNFIYFQMTIGFVIRVIFSLELPKTIKSMFLLTFLPYLIYRKWRNHER